MCHTAISVASHGLRRIGKQWERSRGILHPHRAYRMTEVYPLLSLSIKDLARNGCLTSHNRTSLLPIRPDHPHQPQLFHQLAQLLFLLHFGRLLFVVRLPVIHQIGLHQHA